MKLIVITGPTASGKTELAIRTAEKYNGEIINADSMQLYKYMNIGTAKPTVAERRGIVHRLIDEILPTQKYSVAQYCARAHQCIKEVHEKGRLPILVGGTGLYIDSVVNNITFSDIPKDEKYCDELNNIAEKKGNEYIYSQLQIIDSRSAEKISVNDRRRIIRALEVYKTTGETMSRHIEKSRQIPSPYETQLYAISHERSELYDRINRRVDKMLEAGLVDEVKAILAMGVSEDCTAMQAIGYKETVMYINGIISLSDTAAAIKQATRRYAKRQMTWFGANDKIIWLSNDRSVEIE